MTTHRVGLVRLRWLVARRPLATSRPDHVVGQVARRGPIGRKIAGPAESDRRPFEERRVLQTIPSTLDRDDRGCVRGTAWATGLGRSCRPRTGSAMLRTCWMVVVSNQPPALAFGGAPLLHGVAWHGRERHVTHRR